MYADSVTRPSSAKWHETHGRQHTCQQKLFPNLCAGKTTDASNESKQDKLRNSTAAEQKREVMKGVQSMFQACVQAQKARGNTLHTLHTLARL